MNCDGLKNQSCVKNGRKRNGIEQLHLTYNSDTYVTRLIMKFQ